MIINSSQIRMDASSGHKDVSSTTGGQILSRNHAGSKEEHFSLNLPFIEGIQARQDSSHLAGIQRARSFVEATDHTPITYNDEYVIAKTVDELTGARTAISHYTHNNRSSRRLQDALALQSAEKCFFQVGGQQFKMTFASLKVHYEYEFMDFSSSGEVITADGRSINFNLDLSLQRTIVVHESILGRAASGYFIDPLVLHFDNGLDKLVEQSFFFDIDDDGNKEKNPRPGAGERFPCPRYRWG